MLISSSQKKIIHLLSDGQFHSGTELAAEIGVSRSAICKQLNNLSDLGLEFSAVSGKGYRLEIALQLLSEEAIKESLSLSAKTLISELEIHDCIDSTNNYLVEKSHKSHDNGLVCFAEYQIAGKGRRGREWISPFGNNLYLSVLWRFQSGPASISGLSLAVGVAVIQALNECGVENIGLKWPNDIFWQGKKLAGILIEVSGESDGPCSAVIGLGINLYVPVEKAKSITQDWVDLNTILSKNTAYIRNKLAALLLNKMLPMIATFDSETFNEYLSEWRKYDCMKGKKVNLYMGSRVFTGTVEGIDKSGFLLLRDEEGSIKTFASGEVSFSSP